MRQEPAPTVIFVEYDVMLLQTPGARPPPCTRHPYSRRGISGGDRARRAGRRDAWHRLVGRGQAGVGGDVAVGVGARGAAERDCRTDAGGIAPDLRVTSRLGCTAFEAALKTVDPELRKSTRNV